MSDWLDAEIVFPLHDQQILAHDNRHLLVDVAFWSNHDVEIYSFDPTAMVSFDWDCFVQCLFRWATHCGIQPVSMIGIHLAPSGYDLRHDFQNWLLHIENEDTENEESLTALI